MKQLNSNWITENRIDFEYKKYLLLAYLQEVESYFLETKLYPTLSDIVSHYESLKRIKESKTSFISQLPKLLTSIDLKSHQLNYKNELESDSILEEIELIIDYSIPKFYQYLEQGKNIFDFVEKEINIEPIGVVPLATKFGYLLIRDGSKAETKVYEYHLSVIEQPQEKLNTLKTNYIKSYSSSITNTFNYIKSDMLREYNVFSNPAVFAIETDSYFPYDETLLPIAKRLFLRKFNS